MRRGAKHAGQRTVLFSDVRGGLNTSSTAEMIADGQLFDVVNMEPDPNDSLLRTVHGTRDIYRTAPGEELCGGAYDLLNRTLLLFCASGRVLARTEDGAVRAVGYLTGKGPFTAAVWEDGLLIASGGRLQYARGAAQLKTIASSPAVCKGVYTRSGRVLVYDDADVVHFSGVGDEEQWRENPNDSSAALFAQIGYKVGGRLMGMVSMTEDVLFIKSNGMVFRLRNEYPNWVIAEMGRNMECLGEEAFCNIGSTVLMLGDGALFEVSATQNYGDMEAKNIGAHVKNALLQMPRTARLRYVPQLGQVWGITGGKYVLVYDCRCGAFFQRYFNADVVDVVKASQAVYVVRRNAVSALVAKTFEDAGKPLVFRARFKDTASLYAALAKRAVLSITPLVGFYEDSRSEMEISGDVKVCLPFPARLKKADGGVGNVVAPHVPARLMTSSYIGGNREDVFLNPEYISPKEAIFMRGRILCRDSHIGLRIRGKGFPFILNYIGYDVAEV
jgi:hypothetical protein